MRCRKVRMRLPQYVQGLLTPADADLIRGHLTGCTDCRTAEAGLQRSWEALGDLAVPGESASAAPQVLQRIDAWERRRSGSLLGLLVTLKPSFAGASAAVMLAGFIAGIIIAASQPLDGSGSVESFDAEYADILSDAPPASFFDTYLQITGTANEENS